MFKILIIDTVHHCLEEKFTQAGFECAYMPEISKDEIVATIHLYNALIFRNKLPINKKLLDRAENLKIIGRVGAGLEEVDTDYCNKKNIQYFNASEGNRDAVGEHTLGLLLTLLNKIVQGNNEIKAGQWNREQNRGMEIKGKTIGIIGYGNMGTAFAKRLKGFGAKVIAYDKYKKNYSDDEATEVSLNQLFQHTDILSLHVPLTKETYFMVNKEFIQNFKKNIFILNTSRGKVVQLKDLVTNLKTGKIQGAALDVMESENNKFETIYTQKTNKDLHYIIENNNVILTPHVAGWSLQSKEKLATVLADKIIEAVSMIL